MDKLEEKTLAQLRKLLMESSTEAAKCEDRLKEYGRLKMLVLSEISARENGQ